MCTVGSLVDFTKNSNLFSKFLSLFCINRYGLQKYVRIIIEISGDTTTHQTIDTVMNQVEVVKNPTDFLNSFDLPGMPLCVVTLKFGVPLIILRKI